MIKRAFLKGQQAKLALPWIVIGGSLGLLLIAITAPFWLVMGLRLLPDRYVAAYAPAPLREVVFDTDPQQQLPTAVVEVVAANQLLENLRATPTPLPTVVVGGSPELSSPTPSGSGPQPTFTPAFIQEGATLEPTPGPPPASHSLTGFTHTYQGWNNCGPATITTTLSYWGVEVTQNQAASFLKPNPEDRNVRPDELAAYVESLGYRAVVRINGNLELLKQLIAAGFPVVVEKGFDPEPERLGWMGHYLVLTGFSDAEQVFYMMDSYLGPNLTEAYDKLDTFWWHFNRTYLVVYRPEQAEQVAALIGDDMDDRVMYTRAIGTAQEQLRQNPNDAFGWFNLGSSLLGLGDYQNAATAFDQARELGLPWRLLWYQFGPYEAYLKVGRYEDVLTLADSTVDPSNNPYSEEAFYYRGLVYAERGQTNAARQQFNQALRLNQNYERARQALAALGG